MLGLGWQETLIVVAAIVLIAWFFGIGKLGGNGTSPLLEIIQRVSKRGDSPR